MCPLGVGVALGVGVEVGVAVAVAVLRPISRLDDEFHAAVAKASHNAIYATVLDAVSGLIANARRLSMNVPWASQRARVEHQQLYEAIAAHDAEAAGEIMGTHLDSAIEACEHSLLCDQPVARIRRYQLELAPLTNHRVN